MLEIKTNTTLTQAEKEIRTAVFVEEQGFREEFDTQDGQAVHLTAFIDGKPAGCLRYFTADGKEYHIGRVAVLPEYRKEKLGSRLLAAAEAQICARGAEKIVLSAQCRVASFYEKNGYKPLGDVFYDEFCPHICMEKKLASTQANG